MIFDGSSPVIDPVTGVASFEIEKNLWGQILSFIDEI